MAELEQTAIEGGEEQNKTANGWHQMITKRLHFRRSRAVYAANE
jgi:hypothetical protein